MVSQKYIMLEDIKMSGSARTWTNKCWKCGKPVTGDYSWYDSEEPKPRITTRSYCENCYSKVREAEAKELDKYVKLKKQMMLKMALNRLERQDANMYELKPAIKVVSDKVKADPDKFDSSYEIQAAIILVHNHIYAKMQYKIDKYQVDFLLPEMGVVLEIDGDRHKYKKEYDSIRDYKIKQMLGPGWDIIRIKTEFLDVKAAKLPEAIQAIIDKRQKAI